MKKFYLIIFSICCFFILNTNVAAKDKLVTCYYDNAYFNEFLAMKVKVILYSDKSLDYYIMDRSGNYHSGYTSDGQSYEPKANNAKGPTYQVNFTDSGSKFNSAYESYSKQCPNLKGVIQGSAISYSSSSKGTNTNKESSIWVSTPTKMENGKSEDIPIKDDKESYFECSPVSITSSDIPGVYGGTFYFKLNKTNGNIALCIKSRDANGVNNTDIPCAEQKPGNSQMQIYVTTRNVSYFYRIEGDEINSFYKNIKSDHSSFTCPKASEITIYKSSKTADSKPIVILTKSKDKADIEGVQQTTAKDGENTESSTADEIAESNKITVYRIRKPNVKVDVNIKQNGCNVLGDDMLDFLQWVMDVLRIAGIVLTVVLSIANYISAIASSNKDALSKANKNLSTRIMCVGLLFLIPVVIEFILQLVNIGVTADNPTCGIN